jgi:hypothetical protein
MRGLMSPPLHGGGHGLPHDQTTPHRMAGLGTASRSRTACQSLAACEPVIAHLQVHDLAELVDVLSLRIGSADGPWCDLDQFFVDAISCLWEQIITWSGTTRPYAAGDRLSGVRTRLRTLQATERRDRCRHADNPDALDQIPASIGRTGEELLAAELIEATGRGLMPDDASLLYAAAILGMTVAEVADHTRESVVRLRRRRRNVIAGLVA